MRREWNGKTFELVPTSDGSHVCNECFFYQFIERDKNFEPCEKTGGECCDDENVGKVWKEVVKYPDVVTDEDYSELKLTKSHCSAYWKVSLDCDCPKCCEYVNLLDAPDFWEGRTLGIPEHGTEKSNNLEVKCPQCGHEFKVCCEW